jgi:transglutaminase-like putative cysteine protease
MLIGARHVTRFRYGRPVFCEPLLVRLRPREDAAQRLASYSLAIEPEPAGISDARDFEGNAVATAWFRELTDSLTVTVDWQVETLRTNPFDFLLPPAAQRLPVTPSESESPWWPLYATPLAPSYEVAELTERIARAAQYAPVDYLCRLASAISQTHEKVIRPDGPPWPPDQTLARRQGSCRDLTLVFIEACRAMGIPARFVSGYTIRREPAADQHLHAWAEAYLPGAGWRGFDPMSGLAVADHHVAVAASRTPEGAAPTAGSFRSNTVAGTLEVEIEISAQPAAHCQQQRSGPTSEPDNLCEAAPA